MEAKKKRRKTTPVCDLEPPLVLAKTLNHCDIGMSPQQQKLSPLHERIGFHND